ncbi:LLM class flavin-dependent oxidoreductase [Leptolyngbya sp. NK1-12]|uniref:LLM class flavin-dependent oxidoreductase n=1 Tax=Leptolyngbya sp. NK1-12 TaxID=2547451 RepID=A0AA96WKE8_9CYAN|nr:LLM class flavin-dependent oxidoreductase [Leptolyngbya sp. NK1-12]WNZ27043.1 LLM class flavin-dependent oxidoreductase [Leptolyngbya sp. NK1-12]
MTKQLHLAGFLIASQLTHSHPQWRHPRQDLNFLRPEFYQNIGRILERGKFDYVFFADGLAVPHRYGDSIAETLRRGTQGAILIDPAYVVATMAVATQYIGLGITRSTTYHQPYDLARAFATLDHLSGGRIAWNVVTSHNVGEAYNFGLEAHLEHENRYDRADEFVELTFKLWDSWQEDALVLDKDTGLFADPTKVHHVNHQGQWYKSKGPLTIPRSPQGRPVIMQAGSSNRGKEFAARWAEIIFEIDPTSEGRKAYYDDVKSRALRYGRNFDDVKIFPAVIPFIGETETIAREKQAFHNQLADPISGLITLSSHMDYDFSQHPLDEPVQEMEVGGIRGLFEVALRLSKKEGLTLRDIGRLYAEGILLPHVVGTPAQIADQLEESFRNGEADGFIISPAYLPGAFEEFVEFVVPELQRRGLFRKEYTGHTLRDHLGLGKANLIPYQRLEAAGVR